MTPLQAVEATTIPETWRTQASWPSSGQLKVVFETTFISVLKNILDNIEIVINRVNITHARRRGRL